VKLSRIFWLTILVHAAFASMRVAVSLYGLKLGASALTVGIIMSLIAFLPMLLSVHAGRAIDRMGPRRPMVAGAALITLGLSIVVALPRLESLFFVTSICGLGFLFFHIAVHQAVGLIGSERDRMRNFSLLALAFSTSSFLGPMLAGFCIDGLGYRTTFAVSTLIGVAALAAVLRLKSDPARPADAGAARGRRAFDLLGTAELRLVLGVSGLVSMCWDMFSFAVPIYGVRIGLSASQIGLVLGAFGVAIFFVRLVMPLLGRRVREWPLLIGAMGLTALAFAVFPLIERGPVLAALAFVVGFALGGAQPMIMTLIYRVAPAGRAGEAVGIRTLFLNISQTSVPLLSGAFGAALGIGPAFWFMAVLLGATSWHAHRHERLSRRA
jgi:predicted MFS family arabinose efflux permease